MLKGDSVLSYLGTESSSSDTLVTSIMDKVIEFRSEVRTTSIKDKQTNITEKCDVFRDTLGDLGIRVQDSGNDSKWSFEDKEVLKKEKEEKINNALAKEEKKRKANEEKEAKELEKEEKKKLSHVDMFKTEEQEGYEFDSDGLPLKDKDGVEVTKNQSKKNKKLWEGQKKLHEAWLESKK